MSDGSTSVQSGFSHLGLRPELLRAIEKLGYETPTSIQAQTILPMLAGQDIFGQAQTGTGKTAAFALPLLNYLDVSKRTPQVFVLTPTRELAIQLAEAFEQFAEFMKGVRVLPVYGGADIRTQTRELKKGVQIVVGTPGRIMDHMRRHTLNLDDLTSIVLDEADEMLNMGFQEDVEWILERTPAERHTTLFSATISPAIRAIATKFMNDPQEITVKTETTTAATIHQRFWMINGIHKMDALTRILESEPYDGVIVFARTRAATVEIAEELANRGFNAAPLNGDIPQHLRERTIESLKAGRIHILVATDVAARGLDVDRISHVINYDVPHDAEAYIHRVGRTGRAGRNGEAILFISRRERNMIHVIERATRQEIEPYIMPGPAEINRRRIADFKEKVVAAAEAADLGDFAKIAYELQHETYLDPMQIAAAAIRVFHDIQPLLKPESKPVRESRAKRERDEFDSDRPYNKEKRDRNESGRSRSKGKQDRSYDFPMQSYRVEVGSSHGVKAGNILGAIANESGLDGQYIGKIAIRDDFSLVDLPEGMPPEILHDLKRVMVAGRPLLITEENRRGNKDRGKPKRDAGKRKDKAAGSQRGRKFKAA